MHVTLHYIALHYITLHCITYVRSVGVPDAPAIQSIRSDALRASETRRFGFKHPKRAASPSSNRSVALQASQATRFPSLVRGRPGARDILDIRYKLYIYIYI